MPLLKSALIVTTAALALELAAQSSRPSPTGFVADVATVLASCSPQRPATAPAEPTLHAHACPARANHAPML